MTAFLKFLGATALVIVLLGAIIITSAIHNFTNPPKLGWSKETFYETQVELIYRGQPITLRNGGVTREFSQRSNQWQTHPDLLKGHYSPPLFHKLEDGRILVVVLKSSMIPKNSNKSSKEPYNWQYARSRFKSEIYILDNGEKPGSIELWILKPGSSDAAKQMQFISARTQSITEDKRVWAGDTIPWLAPYEKMIQTAEANRGYGYIDAQKEMRSTYGDNHRLITHTLTVYANKFKCKHNGTGASHCREIPPQKLANLPDSTITSGLPLLDNLLNRVADTSHTIQKQKKQSKLTSISAGAELIAECGPMNVPHLKIIGQPLKATEYFRGSNCLSNKDSELEGIDYTYSIGNYEIVQASSGKFYCPVNCFPVDSFDIAARLKSTIIQPASFYGTVGYVTYGPEDYYGE